MATKDPNFDIKHGILYGYEIKEEFAELVLDGEECGCIECEECICKKNEVKKEVYN